MRIGGDAKFIGGGEPIYSGLAGIPAPPSASQSDRISHHKPFPSQSPLRISFSTQSRVLYEKQIERNFFQKLRSSHLNTCRLYMQIVNHLKMTIYGMNDTDRYGAMNITGVFF